MVTVSAGASSSSMPPTGISDQAMTATITSAASHNQRVRQARNGVSSKRSSASETNVADVAGASLSTNTAASVPVETTAGRGDATAPGSRP